MEGSYEELCSIRLIEKGFLPNPSYLEEVHLNRVEPWMRREVITWLQEIAQVFKFFPETVAVAVNYFDRFMSLQTIRLEHLQLLGATCMLLATKMKEHRNIALNELVAMSADHYNREDIKLMEKIVLEYLSWRMDPIIPHLFAYKILPFCELLPDVSKLVAEYSQVMLDIILPEYEFIRWRPSILGSASVLCAMAFLKVLTSNIIQKVASIVGDKTGLEECCRSAMALFREAYPNEMPSDLPPIVFFEPQASPALSSPCSSQWAVGSVVATN